MYRSPARQTYTLDVELKDSTIAVGEQILLSGDVFLDSSGESLNRVPCFVASKESDGWVQSLKLIDYGSPIGLIAPDTQVDYSSALSSQLEYGFISDTAGLMSDGRPAYTIY